MFEGFLTLPRPSLPLLCRWCCLRQYRWGGYEAVWKSITKIAQANMKKGYQKESGKPVVGARDENYLLTKKCRWRVGAACVHTNFCGLIIPPWSNWQHSSPSIAVVYDTVYWENLCVGGDQDTTQGKVCKSCWGPKSVESSRFYLRGWLCKFITLSMEFRRLPEFAVLRFYEVWIVEFSAEY